MKKYPLGVLAAFLGIFLSGCGGSKSTTTSVTSAPASGTSTSAAQPAADTTPVNEGVAKVEDAYGNAQKNGGDGKWAAINVGDLLPPQTTVRTGDDGAVLLRLAGDHVFRVGAATTVALKELGKNKEFAFNLAAGKVWSMVEHAAQPAKYEVETPSAVVGVSGTVFSVYADTHQDTDVSTDDGVVTVRQDKHVVKVAKGYFSHLKPHQKEEPKAIVQPPEVKAMWQQRRQDEGWLQRSHVFKLNRQFEGRLRPAPLLNAGRNFNPGMKGAAVLAGAAVAAPLLGRKLRMNEPGLFAHGAMQRRQPHPLSLMKLKGKGAMAAAKNKLHPNAAKAGILKPAKHAGRHPNRLNLLKQMNNEFARPRVSKPVLQRSHPGLGWRKRLTNIG